MSETLNTMHISSIREQAAEWVVRLSETGGAQSQWCAACDAWRAQDPRHDQVYRQVEQLWGAVTPAPQKRRRKRIVAGAVVALVMLVAAQLLPLAYWVADQHTVVGEIRRIPLADGSVITLNSGSAVDIQFNASERVVKLVEGEVLAEVAKDPTGRPFRVVGRDGIAQALGTCYIVRQDSMDTTVTVLESKVAVTSRSNPNSPVTVHPGERVRFDAQHIGKVESATSNADGWTAARLVFQDAPLNQVIAELARYRPGLLRVDGEAAKLHFTGVLPADDPDTALAIVMQALPVEIHSITSYLVWVKPIQVAKQ